MQMKPQDATRAAGDYHRHRDMPRWRDQSWATRAEDGVALGVVDAPESAGESAAAEGGGAARVVIVGTLDVLVVLAMLFAAWSSPRLASP